MLLEAWERKKSRLLTEHNDQISQLSDQLHERDLQIKQYETNIQVLYYLWHSALFTMWVDGLVVSILSVGVTSVYLIYIGGSFN